MNLTNPIKSVLDTDLYKFTQQQAVLELYPDAWVEYRFTNRCKDNKFTPEFFAYMSHILDQTAEIRVTSEEIEFLKKSCPFLKPHYLTYLSNYRFDPDEVQLSVMPNGELSLTILGPWRSTILWEVPLMAAISETYFRVCEPDWSMNFQEHRARQKSIALQSYDCKWADFGTRRRRCYDSQRLVVDTMSHFSNFVGTSNVHLAKRYNLRPIGTMSHEFIMGVSVLEGLRHANRFALKKWSQVYNGNLGIALTDTYGSNAFWADFDLDIAKLFDGVRHDSGDPFVFADSAIAHYENLGIDPRTKTIVFSDGLDIKKAIQLKKHCAERIKCSFGIGTHLTNDFSESRALNMVIKMWSINNVPVVKLSDDEGKSQGEKDAVRIAKHIFRGSPL